MATKAEKAAAAAAAKQQPAGDPETRPARARVVVDAPEAGEGQEHTDAADDEMVTCNVPKPFRLTADNGETIQYRAGAQMMPESHANHWYAQAHGVTIVS